jgi:hypothetical protein
MNVSEKNVNVHLNEITMPETYIRKAVDNETVNKWTERIKVQTVEGGKSVEEAWFLPPIVLLKLDKPLTIGYKDRDGKKQTRNVHYRIIEGVKRYLTALAVNKPTIAADLVIGLNPAQEYLEQFSLNATHGESFNREALYNFIRISSKHFKVSGEELAKRTGLTTASISRIIAGKQGLPPSEVSASRKTGAKKRGGKGHRKTGWAPADFFGSIRAMAKECAAKRKLLTEYLGEHDKAWEHAQAMIDALSALRNKKG